MNIKSTPSRTPPSHIHSTHSALDGSHRTKGHKIPRSNPLSLVHIVSIVFLAIVFVSSHVLPYLCALRKLTLVIQVVQFLVKDNPPAHLTGPRRYSPTSYSPPANVVEGEICKSPPPFPTESLVSKVYTMALQAEAKRVAAEFESSDLDVQRWVAEFIKELGSYHQN